MLSRSPIPVTPHLGPVENDLRQGHAEATKAGQSPVAGYKLYLGVGCVGVNPEVHI